MRWCFYSPLFPALILFLLLLLMKFLQFSSMTQSQLHLFHSHSNQSLTNLSAIIYPIRIPQPQSPLKASEISQSPPKSIPQSPLKASEISQSPPKSIEEKVSGHRKERRNSEMIEASLVMARQGIRRAILWRNYSSERKERFVPRGSIYRNHYAFHQSYIEMEKRFKVWSYKEGEPPLVHDGPVNGVYSTEGQFIDEMDRGDSPFASGRPEEAHAFFIPFSLTKVRKFVYKPQPFTSSSRERLQRFAADYINVISNKYPYWNRSQGADHFMVSCHDWAPKVSIAKPELFHNLIRVLCNANSSEGFKPERDATLPDINIRFGHLSILGPVRSPKRRPILAFFAGRIHGSIRKILLKHWKEKDPDVLVYTDLPKGLNYNKMMGKSKFCLCPSGYQVASPRVVEAIYAGCVPVILSDHYILPFSDVLDWTKFSVQVPVSQISEIKTILQGISTSQYRTLQKRVMDAQRHFVLNRPARPYDVMNMVLHSVWLRRLNIPLHF